MIVKRHFTFLREVIDLYIANFRTQWDLGDPTTIFCFVLFCSFVLLLSNCDVNDKSNETGHKAYIRYVPKDDGIKL